MDDYEQKGKRMAKYKRWELRCHRHKKCIKRRSISDAHCKNFGAFEPVAFLACWKDMPCNEGERHVKKLPTFDMVRNFVVANPTFMNDNGIVPPP